MKKKTVLSIILCLAMCLYMIPVMSYADTVTEYGVYVGGEQFTPGTLTIEGSNGGTATYNPVYNKLTLEDYNGGSIITDNNINIYLKGKNTVTAENTESGIKSKNGSISIYGEGSIEVNALKDGIFAKNDVMISCDGDVAINGDEDFSADNGVVAFGNLKINNNGEFTVYGFRAGVNSDSEVSIQGNCNVNITADGWGIVSKEDTQLATSGDISIKSNSCGILCFKDVKCNGCGKIDVDSRGKYAVIVDGGQVLLDAHNTPIIFKSDYTAIIDSGTGKSPVGGANLEKYEMEGNPSNSSVKYSYKVADPIIYVNGERISSNQSKFVRCGEGWARFDDSTDPCTLTLYDATITKSQYGYGIYSNVALRIICEGETGNIINISDGGGIIAEGNLEITGDSDLTIIASGVDEYGDYHPYGVLAYGKVNISGGGNLEINADYGICESYYGYPSGEVVTHGGDIVFSGSGKINIRADKNAIVFKLLESFTGKYWLKLNGSESPIELKSGDGYKAVYVDGKSYPCLIGGSNFDNYIQDGNPDSNHVSYTLKEEQQQIAQDIPFTDVENNRWSRNDIVFAWKNNLMNGISDTKFAPLDNTSRAMIVTILWRLEGEPVVNYAMSFDDVSSDKWYTEAIRWAQSTGIVQGHSSKEFGPDDAVTREQMASILYRYVQHKGCDVSERADLSEFSDYNKIHEWALENLSWAKAAGLINGIGDNRLDPAGMTKREQTAAILHRLYEL